MTYKEKLLDPRWQKKRLEILNRDSWSCQLCFDTQTTLHIHHFQYNGDPWDVDESALVTYCKHCHAVKEYNKTEYPYKVIKLEILKEFIGIAVFYLGFENVFDLFLFSEKDNKISFLTCLPKDFIESIHTHFVTINDMIHG